MRTREEQISELVDGLEKPVCRPDYSVSILEKWLERHILEAERRAEQRVRAEIARDSERLDWLAAQIVRVRAHAPYQPIILNGTYDPGEFRDAIDAEREAQG